MWKIKRNILLDVCEAAKNMYPSEHASLLGGTKKNELIEEFIVPPVVSDHVSASINLFAMPVDDSIIGSIHSHPSGGGGASSADKRLFSRYPVNIIIYWPFAENDFKAYNSHGKLIVVDIVD